MILFFIFKMVYCVYSLDSPRWGSFNEYTKPTFILKKIEKSSSIMLSDLALWLTLISSNYPFLEHIPWFQRCSSNWSSIVFRNRKSSHLLKSCRTWRHKQGVMWRVTISNILKNIDIEVNGYNFRGSYSAKFVFAFLLKGYHFGTHIWAKSYLWEWR